MKMSKVASMMLVALVLCGSISMAKVYRDRVPTQLPGVDLGGVVDLNLVGEGIAKGVFNDRNGRFRGTVRGSAPNKSKRNARFRNDTALLSELGNRISSETNRNISLTRGVYRVTGRGRVRGAATGTASVGDSPQI